MSVNNGFKISYSDFRGSSLLIYGYITATYPKFELKYFFYDSYFILNLISQYDAILLLLLLH
jgi:hypothetical protein